MSILQEILAVRTRPVVTAELPAIDGGDIDTVRRHLDGLLPYVDAVNATDNPAAHAHASSTAVAIAIKQCGGEPILQVVCRDKNRLAIQADIVGAALFGVENVCALSGDDVTAGDESAARRVFDLDSAQVIAVATGLSRGRYLSGRAISPAPRLFVGAVENPGAPPLDYRVQRAVKKSRAGARFLQLQICYHPDRLQSFVAGCFAAGITMTTALLPTICLTKSARALSFMNDKVPGISVPPSTIARISAAPSEASATYDLALAQARYALDLPGVAGIHLADFRHDGSLRRLIEDLGLTPSTAKESYAHRPQFSCEDRHHRRGPAVLHHRGADQPDRSQEVPGAAAGG
jgi:methylenetetrahydrofolate reductase (NADPH)